LNEITESVLEFAKNNEWSKITNIIFLDSVVFLSFDNPMVEIKFKRHAKYFHQVSYPYKLRFL